MPMPTHEERQLYGRLGAHESWARTADRAARTRPAREAMLAKFEREVDPDGALAPVERAIRDEHARKAYYTRLAIKSAQARRAGRGPRGQRASEPAGCSPTR
jgi:hypothetical protein